MPTISSHVLNSENGTHVSDLTITLIHLKEDAKKEIIFSRKTDKGGRLSESFSIDLSLKKKGITIDIFFFIGSNY